MSNVKRQARRATAHGTSSSFPARSALPMALTIAAVELLAVFAFYVIALRAPEIPQPRAAAAAH